jgi:uncharacterized LabA/DUF88 family protein
MTERVMGFVDGENVVLRFQAMKASGKIVDPNVVHIEDLLVWHPEVTNQCLADVQRIYYYQTFIGDVPKMLEAKGKISNTGYKYSVAKGGSGTGKLVPRVFKKEGRSTKTKSVDINLTVDMMRTAHNQAFDVLILFSGDGDYLPLVEEVMRHGKQVWIAAFSEGLNQEMRHTADLFICLDDIFFLKPPQPHNSQLQKSQNS